MMLHIDASSPWDYIGCEGSSQEECSWLLWLALAVSILLILLEEPAKSEAVWDPEELWVGRASLLCFPVFFLTLSKRQPGGGEIILQGN